MRVSEEERGVQTECRHAAVHTEPLIAQTHTSDFIQYKWEASAVFPGEVLSGLKVSHTSEY